MARVGEAAARKGVQVRPCALAVRARARASHVASRCLAGECAVVAVAVAAGHIR